MDYLIGNRNGIIGVISIIEKGKKYSTVYCSFENNFFKKHPFDIDLIMQNPKYNSFELDIEFEEIVLSILNQYIDNFDTIKDELGFYWFKDDWTERKAELNKAFQDVINKYYK
ncbi:MAG: hypothetical protein AB9834_09990 [Lentimicrobium sp.]